MFCVYHLTATEKRAKQKDSVALLTATACQGVTSMRALGILDILLVPRLPSLCCPESEDSIDVELNSENSAQLRLCFLFSATRISHRDWMYCTLSFNCVQVQTLPTAQATPALTDSFLRGYDPYTHACKARPLTTVGWTSLSVIVIVIARTLGDDSFPRKPLESHH